MPVSVKQRPTPPEYDIESTDQKFWIGKTITFEDVCGDLITRRVGELVGILTASQTKVCFEVKPLDERGNFRLWVPILNARQSLEAAPCCSLFSWSK
jgi:hypothetical protein